MPCSWLANDRESIAAPTMTMTMPMTMIALTD